jgi:hypothetical protein
VVVVLEVVQALALNDDNCPTLVNAVPGIVGAMERHPDHVELVTTAMTAMKNMMTVTDVQVRAKCDGRGSRWWFRCPVGSPLL